MTKTHDSHVVKIRVRRVYAPPDSRDDGVEHDLRVLVDRVWPRGMKKEQVQADIWAKDLAPSTALRKWFGHERSRWSVFRDRYFEELDTRPEAVAQMLERARQADQLTLLYAARDTQYNHALVLREYLLKAAQRHPENT